MYPACQPEQEHPVEDLTPTLWGRSGAASLKLVCVVRALCSPSLRDSLLAFLPLPFSPHSWRWPFGHCLPKYNIFLWYFRMLFGCPLFLVFLQVSHDSFPCFLYVLSSFCLLLRFIPCLWFQQQFLLMNVEKILMFFSILCSLGFSGLVGSLA